MNIIETDCGTNIRLVVDGRVDTNTSPQLQQAILNAFQKKNDVVIDFLNVPAISSAGLPRHRGNRRKYFIGISRANAEFLHD